MIPSADEPFVSGPRLVRQAHPELAAAIGSLWVAVTRAGGAVGYVRDAPEAVILAAAERVVAEVVAGREQLLVIGPDHAPVGVVFLRPGDRDTVAHRAEVLRLMVHPDLQGRGWGTRLLDAAVAHATALGIEQLLLSTRGGTSLPEYYVARGWTPVGVWHDVLRLAADDYRDEHWFQKRIRRR